MASHRLLLPLRIFPRGKCPGRPTIKPEMTKLPVRGVLMGPRGIIARRVQWATTFRSRRRGLRGHDSLGADEALVLWPCRQVHTIGVSFPLDAVFCDSGLRVLHVQTLRPKRVSRLVREARCCVELFGGRAEECGVVPGTQLELRK